ncbi:hypothetical protein FISHEDRAFT_78588, partial [Fistulina hepatica ATCC 64428]
FDERFFPGNSAKCINLITASLESPSPDDSEPSHPRPAPDNVPHQGGDEQDEYDLIGVSHRSSQPSAAPAPSPSPEPRIVELPLASPSPVRSPSPVHLPVPPRHNPPRLARPQVSLNEHDLANLPRSGPSSRSQSKPLQPVAHASSPVPSQPSVPPSPNPSPLQSPPQSISFHQYREPTPFLSSDSESDDELLLKPGQAADEVFMTSSASLSLEEALDFAFWHACEAAYVSKAHEGEPNTFSEAMKRPKEEADSWFDAA